MKPIKSSLFEGSLMQVRSVFFAAVAGLVAVGIACGQSANDPRSAQQLAREIDQRLAQRQAEAKVKPAELADDAEFVRRIHLDLLGRVPTVSETRSFLADDGLDRPSGWSIACWPVRALRRTLPRSIVPF